MSIRTTANERNLISKNCTEVQWEDLVIAYRECREGGFTSYKNINEFLNALVDVFVEIDQKFYLTNDVEELLMKLRKVDYRSYNPRTSRK